MRATSKLLALALTAALQPAVAGVVPLGFEDFGGIVSIGSRYSKEGVTFSSNAWGVTADDEGINDTCLGDYFFQPLAKATGRNCGALLLGGDPINGPIGSGPLSFKISSEFGFVGGISFAFALGLDAGAKVEVLDEFGNNLLRPGDGDLSGNACSSGFFFCDWKGKDIKFGDTARSIVFTATDQRLMLDDLVLTTAAAPNPNPLPEPGGIALALSALGVLSWTRKRAAR